MANKNAIGWWLFGALMGVASVGVLVWAALARFEPADPHLAGVNAHAMATSMPAAAGNLPPVEQFARIWTKNVRHSLDRESPVFADTTASPAPAPVAAGPNLDVKLVATAIDSQRSCAIFLDADLNPVVCAVGQVVDGMKVVSVESRKVVLESRGQRVELALPDQYEWTSGATAPTNQPPATAAPTGAPGGPNKP